MRMRTDMGRALEPLLRLFALRGSSVEAHWSQLGIGLEALGYLLARDAGEVVPDLVEVEWRSPA